MTTRSKFILITLLFLAFTLGTACEDIEDDIDDVAVSKNAIINGSDATKGLAPWIAKISATHQSYEAYTGFKDQHCGGALIRPDVVVTAAHCVDGDHEYPTKVTLGDHVRSVSEPGEQEFQVTDVIPHPHYVMSRRNDVALLILDRPAVIDPGMVETIDIAEAFYGSGATVLLTGWGQTEPSNEYYAYRADELQAAEFVIYDDERCNQQSRSRNGSWQHAAEFCTIEPTGTVRSSHGDSGSPVAVSYDGDNGLAGVVSSGIGAEYRAYPRMRDYASWIGDELGEWSRPCSGRTLVGATKWIQNGDDEIYVDVDTSACGLTSTPRYFTSLGGSSKHWETNGVTSLKQRSSEEFRVTLRRSGVTPQMANDRNWRVNWEAIPSSDANNTCTGRTSTNNTNWKQYGHSGVYVDIDTSNCGFSSAPRYFTSLGGQEITNTRGATSIYKPKKDGFRVYIYRSGITVAEAKDLQWHITWQGVPSRVNYYDGLCVGSTPTDTTNWKQYGSHGVYVDIDTSHCGFNYKPLVFTSIGGSRDHWTTRGATAIYSVKNNKFRVYVYRKNTSVANAKDWNWHINWKLIQ